MDLKAAQERLSERDLDEGRDPRLVGRRDAG